MAHLDQDRTSDEFTAAFPNFAGIMPFNDLESATELDDVYGRLVPYETDAGYGYYRSYVSKGNWFAAAIKRRRIAEIKASRPLPLDVSAALNLPVELLLEIFEFLHPVDLHSIVRSTKKLRGILLDRRASAVWKGAFERCADLLPPCPQDVSEPKWASMLFGPALCDNCGRKGAMIDFHVRWRFCQCCMDDIYVDKPSLNPEGPWNTENSDADALWKCIPSTYRRDQRIYPKVWEYDDREPRYLKRDISEMNVIFSAFLSDIDIPGVDRTFQIFKRLAIDRTSRRLEESKKANACMVGMISPIVEEYDNNLEQSIERHASVLLRRGHKKVDLDPASHQLFRLYLRTKRFQFNYRSYKKLALDILHISEAHKVRRLMWERRWLISGRKSRVNDIYIAHQKTLPPSSWPNLPKEQAIYEYGPFADFIASESRQVGELPEGLVQSHLEPFLDSWMQARESALSSKLASTDVNPELVVNVFNCPHCITDWRHTATMVGSRDLRSHFKCVDPLEFQFSFSGRACALALLDLLKLDSNTATVDDLDTSSARFLCESCDISWTRKVRGCQVLTWRECISHAIEMENTGTHRTASWGLLTAEATESVRRHEQPYPKPESDIWCCNHCPAHVDRATTKTKAFCHAREKHSIARPRLNFDVVYDRRKVIAPRKPVCIGYVPLAIYQCGKCPDTINRLWRMECLERHLRDKHQITESGPDDWRTVKIVEKSVKMAGQAEDQMAEWSSTFEGND